MSLLRKILFHGTLFVVLTSVGIGIVVNKLCQPAPVPQLTQQWWGPGAAGKDDPAIKPFKINVPDKLIADLKTRLELATWKSHPLEGVHFEYGFNADQLKPVIDFWLKEYNWKERQAFLNSFPHFKTQVSGLDLHFIHAKPQNVPQGVKVLPLLLLHGWPGSIREFYDVIPLLTTPRKDMDFVFEIIAPSLPGYGFSQAAARPGLGSIQIGVVFKALMEKLGFTKFYIQGGDWGSAVGSNMATLFPENVLGYHSNLCIGLGTSDLFKWVAASWWPSFVVEDEYADRMYPVGEKFANLVEESGYMHIQASKPNTIGIALGDSPIGLAAYILEKFSTWTEPKWKHLADGGLTQKYSLTNLLDNVMIYWVTGSITTSMRLYAEHFSSQHRALNIERVPCTVPTACAVFPNEIFYSPESIVKNKYHNLIKFTHLPRGGHFAAFEEPQLLADDVWDAIKMMRHSNTN